VRTFTVQLDDALAEKLSGLAAVDHEFRPDRMQIENDS
jgi:predicted transcriptional regulator